MRLAGLVQALVLLTAGCRAGAAPSPPAPPGALVGTSWRAEELDGRPVLAQEQSTLTFESPRRISGRAACNQYFGDLELDERAVRMKPTGTTRMACAPAIMDQERRFLAVLGTVTSARRDGDRLLLLDPDGRVRARLVPLGVEFRASGNEPGWTLDVLVDRLVFAGDYGTRRAITPRPAARTDPTSNETVYRADTEVHRLTVRIRPGPCVDSMSGDRYPFTVAVEFDGTTYRGCGRTFASP
jgi:heat shock protein HslJ